MMRGVLEGGVDQHSQVPQNGRGRRISGVRTSSWHERVRSNALAGAWNMAALPAMFQAPKHDSAAMEKHIDKLMSKLSMQQEFKLLDGLDRITPA
jgi:hypothetical protein